MLRKLKLHISNMANNPRFLAYATKRLAPLERLFKSADGVRWNIRLSKDGHSKKGDNYRAEAQVKTANKNFGADASGESPFEAIDELRDELSGKITNHKDKHQTRIRKGGAVAKDLLKQDNHD